MIIQANAYRTFHEKRLLVVTACKHNPDCPDRIDNYLDLESALVLRETKVSNRFAKEANQLALDAKIWSIIAIIIAVIAVIVP